MALFDDHKNLAYSTVATAPSPTGSGTSLVVAAGDGLIFPAVPFNATCWPAGQVPTHANAEIIRVTNIVTDTFTIVRGQEGLGSVSINVGFNIADTATVKTFTDLENLHTITTQSGNYGALTTDSTIIADATSAGFTVTLPTAIGVAGKTYTVKKIDSTSNVVTVNTSSSQTIDGVLTQGITAQYTSITVISDGANWFIV